MVGRELQKIRPYGEDHQGLVPVREGTGVVGKHKNGKKKNDLKR